MLIFKLNVCRIKRVLTVAMLLLLNKPAKYESDRIHRVLYHISSKIVEISNSFLFVIDKERMREFVKFFP